MPQCPGGHWGGMLLRLRPWGVRERRSLPASQETKFSSRIVMDGWRALTPCAPARMAAIEAAGEKLDEIDGAAPHDQLLQKIG
jgi:hypothetical protein